MTREIDIVELACMVNGKIIGDFKDLRIGGTCAIDKYVKNKLSFIRNEKYAKSISILQNAIILIPKDLIEFTEKFPHNTYIVVDDVSNSLIVIQNLFYKNDFIISREGIENTAKIDSNAKIGNKTYIGENVFIGENVVIGDRVKILHNSVILNNVVIGNDTHIYPNVFISNCEIGEDCLIHSGVRIGIDGFRFEQNIMQKTIGKMLHVGKVSIRNNVEIGANSCIDRATFQDTATLISDDVKIDNLVHIAHNAEIGSRTCIVANSCICGSTKIGEDVFIGAGATVSDGVCVGNRAKILLNAVVAYDVGEDEMVSGFYAMPHKQWKRVFNKLKSL